MKQMLGVLNPFLDDNESGIRSSLRAAPRYYALNHLRRLATKVKEVAVETLTWIIPLFLACTLVFGQTTTGTGRTLLAEGDSGSRSEHGSRLNNHWKLWQLDDGAYEVVDSSAKDKSSVQIFHFDRQFLPSGYTMQFGAHAMPPSSASSLPGWTISCQYLERELKCDAESSEGRKATTSVEATSPYLLVGEFYDLDLVWFLTGAVHLASDSKVKDGSINVYALTSGINPGDIALKLDNPMKIVFAGEETAQVLGKTQKVRKYKWGPKNRTILQVTLQGLVVSLSNGADPSAGFAISNYREYEPWGVALASATTGARNFDSKASTAPRRVQVSSGVMAGLLLRRVGPVYPQFAKQNHVGGRVLLRAVISTQGKVVSVEPISGPQELVAAAVSAVRQWRYRPYVISGQAAEVDTEIAVNFALPL